MRHTTSIELSKGISNIGGFRLSEKEIVELRSLSKLGHLNLRMSGTDVGSNKLTHELKFLQSYGKLVSLNLVLSRHSRVKEPNRR